MSSHDHGYKLLFSHPEMVRDLLTGFVDQPWLAELDLATLEKVSGSYVSDDLRDREDDLIWRVRFRERWLYLYLLLEFQSSVDPWMAVRLLTYLGLLYQDLIRQGHLSPAGRLPPVLPLVLYNGKPRWRAATELGALIEPMPAGLREYAPRLGYLLLDEGALDETGPWALRNLAAALFRLEKSASPTAMAEAVGALVDWLGAPEQASLRRAFAVWIKRVLLPGRLPGVTLPELGDLLDIRTMLAETVVEWTEQWKQQGLQEGLREGLQKGLQEGLEQGLLQGLDRGRLEGEAAVLERLLARRFGPLADSARARLRSATLEELDAWTERLLDAPTLAAVFDGE